MSDSGWTVTGADGQPIIGNTETPSNDADPRGVALILHGFLGYKDYGMFPRLARELADSGFIAHRFNLSHSGMTNAVESFERPDLFERDTWNKQVFDVDAVVGAIQKEAIAGAGLPYVLFGHSRGGATALLAAGRRFRDDRAPFPAGVIAASTPSATCRFPEGIQQQLLEQGYYEVKSNRTGQILRVGRQWLVEQRDQPEDHDLTALVSQLQCPVLFIHGADDPTVPARDASALAQAATAAPSVGTRIIEGGDHVFNTPNPMPEDASPSPQFEALVEACREFLDHAVGAAS
ncbi:MAG: alpha/beta hydrolase [Phycisphaerales bacterium]